jgi:predicted ATPase/DNA-binding CsgD family transcriptional regulator
MFSGSTPTVSGETFSRREVEILGLIAEGLSNQAIAQKLYLSLETIKWYNKQIYSKLGVISRTQAIARAREVGLFDLTAATPVRDASRPNHNFPSPVTSYVGRKKERSALLRLLRSETVRLVTIVGAGGMGKTRLAFQAAEEALSAYAQGAWLVDLSALADPNLVAQSVVNALGWRGEADIPYDELLVRILQPSKLLLLLDNCEHLIETCACLAASLLKSCPDLRILTTSREALGVEGEALYPLATLSFPDPNHLPPLEELQQYEAVQLFCDRAVLVNPGFTVTQENAQSVAQLCQRLDGMPLALELAAARTNLLSPAQMVDRLDARFWMLTASIRIPLPRHRSLQACLDWSFALLSAEERTLLRRLAIFTGGWTLEAAEAICSGGSGEAYLAEPLEPAANLDLLSQLVNKSLVVAFIEDEPKPGQGMRYRMLDTIHQYAYERMVEAGEELTLRDHHLEYYTSFVEQVAPKLKTAEQEVRLRQLEVERDNLIAALSWALVEGGSGSEPPLARVEKGLRMGNGLLYFWDLSSYFQGCATWLAKGLAQVEGQEPRWKALRARTLYTLGYMHGFEGNDLSKKALEESIVLFRECGDLTGLALALAELAWSFSVFDQAQARSLVDESLSICRQLRDQWNLAFVLWVKMNLAEDEADSSTAITWGKESLALFREIGDAYFMNTARSALGLTLASNGQGAVGYLYLEEALKYFLKSGGSRGAVLYTLTGLVSASYFKQDFRQMGAYAQEAMEISRERAMGWLQAGFVRNLGAAGKHLGDLERAAAFFLESLSRMQALEDRNGICEALAGMAGIAAAGKYPVRAAHLLGAVEAQIETLAKKMRPMEKAEFNYDINQARSQLDEATFTTAWEEGRAMSLEQAIQEGCAIQEAVYSAR